jgi:hypothetical protein
MDHNSIKFFYNYFFGTLLDNEYHSDTDLLMATATLIHDHNENQHMSGQDVQGKLETGKGPLLLKQV